MHLEFLRRIRKVFDVLFRSSNRNISNEGDNTVNTNTIPLKTLCSEHFYFFVFPHFQKEVNPLLIVFC